MVVIGIDVGLGGGIAIFDDGKLFAVHDIPTFTVKSGKKSRREYNPHAITDLLRKHQYDENTMAVMEKVNAFPGQGVSSVFKFGEGFGIWKGVLAAMKIPFELVPPPVWKRAMLPGMGKEKDASRMKAIELFPSASHLFARKKDHGKAEAALMGEYMIRRLGKEQDDGRGEGRSEGSD
jgi:crossover junction endodeoxyribonuclease RuvC